MYPVQLITQALAKQGKSLPDLPCEPVIATCAVTGETCLCLPRKYVLGKAFTNGDLLVAPSSAFVSLDVFYAWNFGYKTSPEKKISKKPERMSSWFCDGDTFEELNRIGVRQKVFQEAMPSIWCAYATTSYKKHGSLLAKVNTGMQRFWLFEERQINCSDMVQVNAWWERLNTALRAGIGRMVLESLDCPPYLIQKVGLKTWLDFKQWAKDKYLSGLYAFLCYLLPSQEEMKNAKNS